MNNLAASYASTRYSAQTLGNIGITTKFDGQLQVDEKKLASAMEKSDYYTSDDAAKYIKSYKTSYGDAVRRAFI